MDGDALDQWSHELHLACVETDSNLQSDRPELVHDGQGAPDGPGRPVESRQEPIPSGVDLGSRGTIKKKTDENVVSLQQDLPRSVNEPARSLGRSHDDGKQDHTTE